MNTDTTQPQVTDSIPSREELEQLVETLRVNLKDAQEHNGKVILQNSELRAGIELRDRQIDSAGKEAVAMREVISDQQKTIWQHETNIERLRYSLMRQLDIHIKAAEDDIRRSQDAVDRANGAMVRVTSSTSEHANAHRLIGETGFTGHPMAMGGAMASGANANESRVEGGYVR